MLLKNWSTPSETYYILCKTNSRASDISTSSISIVQYMYNNFIQDTMVKQYVVLNNNFSLFLVSNDYRCNLNYLKFQDLNILLTFLKKKVEKVNRKQYT